jgi:hypothetical protein
VTVARDEVVLAAYLTGMAMRHIADFVCRRNQGLPYLWCLHTLSSLRLAKKQLAEITMQRGFDDDLAAQVLPNSLFA